MRPDPFDPRGDDIAVTPMRPAMQRVPRTQRGRLARRQHQSVAREMLERKVLGVKLFEHRRHLRTSQQGDRDQVVALEPGLRRRRPMPAAPRHQPSRPNSTITVDLGLAPSIGGNRSIHRSEEHTSEIQSPMRLSYAFFFLKKKKT